MADRRYSVKRDGTGGYTLIHCARCGDPAYKLTGGVNRSLQLGMALYCGRACAGLAKTERDTRTPEQRIADKATYDALYRERNRDARKAQKAAYHLSTYDPAKAAADRKARMPRHVEYCRRPEYRAYKRAYDQKHLATKHYGDFAEAALALRAVETEVSDRIDRYDIYAANGTLNKKQERRRDHERTDRIQPKERALGDAEQHQDRGHATGSGGRRGLAGEGDPAHRQDATPGGEPVEALDPRRPDLLFREVAVSQTPPVSCAGNSSVAGNVAAGILDGKEER